MQITLVFSRSLGAVLVMYCRSDAVLAFANVVSKLGDRETREVVTMDTHGGNEPDLRRGSEERRVLLGHRLVRLLLAYPVLVRGV
jgi:hypothetical protein